MPDITCLSQESYTRILYFLSGVDVAAFRLTCRLFQIYSRYTFTRRFLKRPRIRLTYRYLKQFLHICSDESIAIAIKELHISMYMPDPACSAILHQLQSDADASNLDIQPHLEHYVNTFDSEPTSDRDTASYLARILSKLPNLRVLSLCTATQDLGDFVFYEKRILRGLSVYPYRRYYHKGDWRFMQLQCGRVISITFLALTMIDAPSPIERLVIDRWLPTGTFKQMSTSVAPLPPFNDYTIRNQIPLLVNCLQNLHTIELGVFEHKYGPDICDNWVVSLVNAMPTLRTLKLTFYPYVTPEELESFTGLIHMLQLKKLCVSKLAKASSPDKVIALAKRYPNCQIHIVSFSFSLRASFASASPDESNFAYATNLHVSCRFPASEFGHIWFSEVGPRSQRESICALTTSARPFAGNLADPYSIASLQMIFYAPSVNWSKISLQVVSKFQGQEGVMAHLPEISYSSWFYFLLALSQKTKIGVYELRSFLDVVHVSTDGIPVLKLMNECYMASFSFRRNIASADCWIESGPRHCHVVIEVCKDGRYWANSRGLVHTLNI